MRNQRLGSRMNARRCTDPIDDICTITGWTGASRKTVDPIGRARRKLEHRYIHALS